MQVDPANPGPHLPRGDLGRGARRAPPAGCARSATQRAATRWPASARPRARTRKPICSRSWSAPGFGTNNVDHCTRLCHASSVAALMEGIGSGAVTAPFVGRARRRRHHRDRRQPDAEPPGRRDLHQERGEARRQADRHRSARPEPCRVTRPTTLRFKPGQRRGAAERDAPRHHHRGPDRQAVRRRLHRGLRRAETKVEGFSPEAMAPVCGMPAETIREVARLYAPRGRRSSSGAWASPSTSTAPTMRAA